MNIELDKQQGYVKDNKFNQREALINAGVKAAVCFKEAKNNIPVSPLEIRTNETEEQLLIRGINTILAEHTTPTEHQLVSLEITNIPKILCMILNNEHQYTTCERSLRYTLVEINNYINQQEVELYYKWLEIFQGVLSKNHQEFFEKHSKSEALKKSMIKKIAQENARYMVSVFMPTTITYTVPFAQINKIALYMQEIIDNPMNDLEEKLVVYLQDFIKQLKDLKVLITKDDIYNLCNEEMLNKLSKSNGDIASYKGDCSLIYKNNKHNNLSIFAYRNPFSGINLENEYGVNISYNHFISMAGYAQEHRHRTADLEMLIPDEFAFVTPELIKDDRSLTRMWAEDMQKVDKFYPQAMLVKANTSTTLKNVLKYLASERACDRAQLEIASLVVHQMIPDIYENLVKENKQELAEAVKPYVKKLRCGFNDYNCPSSCHHPRLYRKF